MGQTNVHANGFSSGNVSLNMPPGNMVGNGLSRTQNDIPKEAATQANLSPAVPPTSVVSNPGLGVVPANAGQRLVTTKDSSGKTPTVHGTVAGVTVNNPA